MGRYIEAKCRLCRREGVKLFLKAGRCDSPKCPIEKKGAVPPGMHGTKRRGRKSSEYSGQLRAKQKVKRIYGIFERQLKLLYKEAKKERRATGKALISFLERRLDNTLFRLGLAPSRSAARQIVSHRQVMVNGKKVNIASFRVKKGDVISLTDKALKIPGVKQMLDAKALKLPSWLERKGPVGRITELPSEEDFSQEINIQLLIEFCSRQ